MIDPLPMLKIRVIALARYEQPLLEALGRLGVIQITDPKLGVDPWVVRNLSSAQQQNELRLSRIDLVRNQLDISITEDITPSDSLFDTETELLRFQDQSLELKERRRREQDLLRELEEQNAWLLTYGGTGLAEADGDSRFLWTRTGTLPEANWEDLERGIGKRATILCLPCTEGRLPIVVLASSTQGPDVEQLLSRAGFDRHLAPSRQTVQEIDSGKIEQVKRNLENTQERYRNLRKEAQSTLQRARNQVEVDRRLLEAKARILDGDRTFLLEGWLPAVDLPRMEDCIRKCTSGSYLIEAAEALSEDQVPTVLRHGWLLRPFAMLVTAYGLPSYRELVPTLFLALTYLIMFGLMFGDWGHGLVLVGLGIFARTKKKIPWSSDVGVLLIAGGLSSMGFGVVYGSCFGIDKLKHYALWHDPLEGNPAELMVATIAFGAIILSLGVVLNIVNKFRQGEFREAILSKFGILGLLFYWGLIATITLSVSSRFADSSIYWIAPMLAIPLGTWALREPAEMLAKRRRDGLDSQDHDGGLGTALATSLVETFDAVLVFFANSISFVRLAAYAMSHAALLMAMFTLAAQLESIPRLGPFLSVLVLAFGNLIVIVLEGVIAAVQALRLQYYEFFGKFYSGTGYVFTPFRL